MIFTPTYGGIPMFGLAVHMQEVPAACAAQSDSFFGVPGMLSVFGGTRGRSFQISGVLFDLDIPTLNSDEDLFTPGVQGSMADGIARPLFDTRGRTWANVVYLGEFQADPMGPRPGAWAGTTGWVLPYRAVFHGLS
jgi:hypothetical protein